MARVPLAWSVLASATFALPLIAQAQPGATPPAQPPPPKYAAVEYMRAEAGHLLSLVKTEGGQKFLIASNWGPVIETPRLIYANRQTHEAATPQEFSALSAEKRQGLESTILDEEFYFHTFYGSPLAYCRPLDLLCQAAGTGSKCFSYKQRLLDFGCGGVVHLRLLASLGMDVVGVDVDPILRAFFREEMDQGSIPGAQFGGELGPPGNLRLVFARWPFDAEAKRKVGGEFDFVVAKNTLKKGFINPEKPVDDRLRVKLGVKDEEFLGALYAALKPGGMVMIYNLCPAQGKETYIPWADGRCPFPREMLEKAGFRVLEFDRDDTLAGRDMARRLEWNKGDEGMDIENDLFATYTLLQRPGTNPAPAAPVAPATPGAGKP